MRSVPPLVERRISLPSLLNLSPVHSHVRSYWSLKVANGPCWWPNRHHVSSTWTKFYNLYLVSINWSPTFTLQRLLPLWVFGFSPYRTTSGHKVWPSPNWFRQQRWDPLDQRSTLVSPEGAWGPECWKQRRGEWWDSCGPVHVGARSEGHSQSCDKRHRLTWQFGDRKSHSRLVLSNEPEINVSSTGDIERDVTLNREGRKQQKSSCSVGIKHHY